MCVGRGFTNHRTLRGLVPIDAGVYVFHIFPGGCLIYCFQIVGDFPISLERVAQPPVGISWKYQLPGSHLAKTEKQIPEQHLNFKIRIFHSLIRDKRQGIKADQTPPSGVQWHIRLAIAFGAQSPLPYLHLTWTIFQNNPIMTTSTSRYKPSSTLHSSFPFHECVHRIPSQDKKNQG